MNCPTCGRKLVLKKLATYEAGHLVGMRSVTVRNIPALVCPKDKSALISGPAIELLHTMLLEKVLSDSHILCGEEVRFVRKALGLSQGVFADRLGVHRVTVARWETGETPLDGPTSLAVRALAAIPVVADAARNRKSDTERDIRRSFETAPTPATSGSYTLTSPS
jgi:DNA-binding transcriptional regulator YiaG